MIQTKPEGRWPNQSMKPTPKVFASMLAPLRYNFGVFATTPSTSSRFPAALVRFASSRTHSRRIVFQRLPWLMMFSSRENSLGASRPCRTASRGLHSLSR